MAEHVYRRLQTTGRSGRAWRLGAVTSVIGLAGAGVLVWALSGAREVPVYVTVPAAISTACFAWAWVRFPAVGVYTSADSIRVSSWFSSRVYPKSQLTRFSVGQYYGLLAVLGWTSVSGSLQSGCLVASDADGRSRKLPGSVTSYREARIQAEELNRWLRLAVGAGTGLRRTSSRRSRMRKESSG